MAKCVMCKKEDKTPDMINVANRKYVCTEKCKSEYELKSLKKDSEKTQEQKDREELIDYIYKLYDKNIPVFVFKQIKDYNEKDNMKYKGMLLALQYAFEIEELNFDIEKGVGIIPYYYTKARNLYIKKIDICNKCEKLEEDETIIVKKVDNKRRRSYNYDINMNE